MTIVSLDSPISSGWCFSKDVPCTLSAIPMLLRLDKLYRAERYYLSTGWRKFRRKQGLSIGDICVFKLITSEHKLYLAKLTKEKRSTIPSPGEEFLDASKRRCGMPQQQQHTRVIYF